MSAPLIPNHTSQKSHDQRSPSDREHMQRVARAKAVDAEMARINRGAGTRQLVTSSHGGTPQALSLPEDRSLAVVVAKAEPTNLHPRVKALKTALSTDAADLLSLVLRVDEAYKGARLLDLTAFAIGQALNIHEKDALGARSELERAGLIVFRDDGSGNRGFIPRLP